MDLLIVGNDNLLADALGKSGRFASVRISAELREDAWREAAGIAVVSGETVDVDRLLELRGLNERARLVYLLDSHDDYKQLKRAQSLCAAHRVDFITPGLTAGQTAGEIVNVCYGESAGTSGVVTAIGAGPQVGLTTSLLKLGAMLGQLCGIRIGILGMNGWNPGDSGIAYSGKYVDDLWGALQGKQLSPDELYRSMHPILPNVRYLAGNRDMKKLYYYQPDGAAWLIAAAKRRFDLVLIDAGAYLDHALAAQSVYESDLLLVQLNQSRQAREQWTRLKEQILRPVFHTAESKSMLLFNKMVEGDELESPKQLSRQLEMPYVASLPYLTDWHRYEAERKLPLHRAYDDELGKACRALVQYYGLQTAPQRPEVTGESHGTRWRLLRWLAPAGRTEEAR